MAVKRISKDQLIEQGAIEGIIQDMNKLEEVLKQILKTNQQILKANPFKTGADVQAFNKATASVKNTEEALSKIKQARIKEEEKLKQLRTTEADKLAEVKILTQEQTKINKQLARENLGLVGAYEKQAKKLVELRKRYKDVALSQGENSKAAQNLRKRVVELDERLKRVDASVGQFQRNVGNYSSAFSKLGGVLRSVAQAAGATFGIFGAVRVIQNGIKIIKDFELANAVLAGVLGKTRNEIKELTEDAIRLGSVTEFTAAQVTSLQEAYARLGFSQQQILAVTEATLRGATALQSELGETAELVGATLNQFQLPAEEAKDVVDVLARSTQISALNFERLAIALPIVGKTANVVGVDLRQTASFLGVLASNGIDASTAGTGLRNIFIDLQKQGLTFNEAMAKINNSSNAAATAFDLFGKRGVTVAATLAGSLDKIDEYNGLLEDVAGTSKKLAEEQLNTLDGSLKILNSAWEGYVLNLNDVTKAGNFLTKSIRFLAENLNIILDAVRNTIIAFASYRLALLAYRTVAIASTIATKGFNVALKANPIGGVITALTALISLIPIFTKETKEASEELNNYNDELERTEAIRKRLQGLDARIDAIAGLSQQGLKDLKRDIEVELNAIQALEDRAVVERQARQRKLEEAELILETSRRQLKEETEVKAQQFLQTTIAFQLDQIKKLKEADVVANEDIIKRKGTLKDALNTVNGLIVEDVVKSTKESVERSETILEKFVKDAKQNANRLLKEIDVSPIDIPEIEDPFGKLFDAEEEVAEEADILIEKYRKLKELQAELIEKTLEFLPQISKVLDMQDRKEQQLLDNRLNRAEENIEQQQRLAERGLANTLAFEQQKAAKLEAERERLAKRAEKRQKTLAYLTAFTEYLKQDPNSAAGKALAQVAIAETISGFFHEGTEEVGKDGGVKWRSTGKDDYLVAVHKGERIMTAEQNRMVGDLSNEDLANIAYYHRTQGVAPSFSAATFSDGQLQKLSKTIAKSIDISIDTEGFVTRKEFEEGVRKIVKFKPTRRI